MLLWECVEAYSELDEEQQRVYKELQDTESFREIEVMMTTTYEKCVDRGRREALRWIIEDRFGPLSEMALQRLEAYSADKLKELVSAVAHGKTLRDVGLED